jgi:outer membrane lipoprotein-sorting protein
MRRRAILLGGLLAAAAVQATEPVAPIVTEVRRRLGDAAVVRGEFEQRKTLQAFRNPLVSRGSFVAARGRGVVWTTRSPFASTLVVTRDRLLVRDAKGAVATRMNAADEPSLRAINGMLLALIAGDLQILSQRFTVEGELPDAERWHLVLAPRDAALRQWMARIDLEGDRFVRSVKLVEAQGDSTLIRFSQLASGTSLSADEEQRLE